MKTWTSPQSGWYQLGDDGSPRLLTDAEIDAADLPRNGSCEETPAAPDAPFWWPAGMSAVSVPEQDVAGADTGWLAQFGDGDKATFFTEMRSALDEAERTGDASVVDAVLSAWKVTAVALSDPDARAVLTGPICDGDFTEVQRPGDPP